MSSEYVLHAVSKPKEMGTYEFFRSPSIVLGQLVSSTESSDASIIQRAATRQSFNSGSTNKTDEDTDTDQQPQMTSAGDGGGGGRDGDRESVRKSRGGRDMIDARAGGRHQHTEHRGVGGNPFSPDDSRVGAVGSEVLRQERGVGVGVVAADNDDAVKLQIVRNLQWRCVRMRCSGSERVRLRVRYKNDTNGSD